MELHFTKPRHGEPYTIEVDPSDWSDEHKAWVERKRFERGEDPLPSEWVVARPEIVEQVQPTRIDIERRAEHTPGHKKPGPKPKPKPRFIPCGRCGQPWEPPQGTRRKVCPGCKTKRAKKRPLTAFERAAAMRHKLTEDQRKEVLERIHAGDPVKTIAQEFGIAPPTVSGYKRRARVSHPA